MCVSVRVWCDIVSWLIKVVIRVREIIFVFIIVNYGVLHTSPGKGWKRKSLIILISITHLCLLVSSRIVKFGHFNLKKKLVVIFQSCSCRNAMVQIQSTLILKFSWFDMNDFNHYKTMKIWDLLPIFSLIWRRRRWK